MGRILVRRLVDTSINDTKMLSNSINSVLNELYDYIDDLDKVRLFNEKGGVLTSYINDTGANSIKGTTLTVSTSVNDGVKVNSADIPNTMGIMYSHGVPNGGRVWVVTMGPAQVLLEDGTAATRGYWVKVSDSQNGRADATNPFPPGGGIPEIDDHFSEIGHCMEDQSSGTDVLCWVHTHYN
jgi:hypothetical protein